MFLFACTMIIWLCSVVAAAGAAAAAAAGLVRPTQSEERHERGCYAPSATLLSLLVLTTVE